MTLEIDILIGHTKNSMKHLGKNTNDSDDDDKKDKKADVATAKPKTQGGFKMDHGDFDIFMVESNMTKIKTLEKAINNFV